MMGSNVLNVSIDRLPSNRPVSQQFSNEANHSAGYIPGDRERRVPQSNLTLNPAQVELAPVEHAAPACSLVSFLPQVSGRLKIRPLIMALFSTKVGSYGSS